MRYLALLPGLVLALAACSDAPVPTEVEPRAEHTRAMFNTAESSNAYTAIDLGTLGGTYSYASAINEAGHVVGFSTRAPGDGNVHAFLWDGTVMEELDMPDASYSAAYDINNPGQVAGTFRTRFSSGPHAFVWDGTGVLDLGTLGGSQSYAYGINDAGQVVGLSITAASENRAFLWDGTEMQDLGTLGGLSSWARGINDVGQVVGSSNTASGDYWHAFLWDDTGMLDLGTLGGTYSQAWAISNAGQVVGNGNTAALKQHAFLWVGAEMQDLGTLGGTYCRAYGINAAGQVVGYSFTASGEPHAFLWDGNVMQDLGTLGGYWSLANDINDAGQVVGFSYTASGQQHATLWRILTPVEQLESCAASASELEAQGVLNRGQTHSLVNKINLATAALNDAKNTPAINILKAFQSQASAFVTEGDLTQKQGDELNSCVQDVIDDIGG